MQEIRASGTWGSVLTSDEFAAIRSVGFEPVGQVLGAAVYNIGYTGGYNCPGAWGSWGYGVPARTVTQVSSLALGVPFLVPALDGFQRAFGLFSGRVGAEPVLARGGSVVVFDGVGLEAVPPSLLVVHAH